MKQFLPKWLSACFLALLMAASPPVHGQDRKVPPTVLVLPNDSVGQLVSLVREKAKSLEGSSGMRLGFQAFTTAHGLAAESIRYSDYVIVRLLFEATRDAGFRGGYKRSCVQGDCLRWKLVAKRRGTSSTARRDWERHRSWPDKRELGRRQ